MTGQAAGGGSIKVWSEAAHMAASLTLLQITSVDLMIQPRHGTLGIGEGIPSHFTASWVGRRPSPAAEWAARSGERPSIKITP